MRRSLSLLLLLGIVPVLAGCGSESLAALPPVATPAASTPPDEAPAGRVFRRSPARDNGLGLGAGPNGLKPLPGRKLARTATVNEGRTTLTLDPRARRVTARGAVTGTVGAGWGPAEIASNGEGTAYVTDAVADGVVVVRAVDGKLAVSRRVGLPDSTPWGVVFDKARNRLWVTLTATNELAELEAGARPRELRRYPTIRSPRAVYLEDDGTVVVEGPDAFQRVTPRG